MAADDLAQDLDEPAPISIGTRTPDPLSRPKVEAMAAYGIPHPEIARVPRTPADLHAVGIRTLEEIGYDLANHDFGQAGSLALLPLEVDVQGWIADRLHQLRGRSYSVDREPHVADEKEPDIRLRAKESDASVPIEVKVAESWTLPQLEDALLAQLAGRYLRDRENRFGILLLVHQKTRPVGWFAPGGTAMSFHQVIEHLRQKAEGLAKDNVPPTARKVATVVAIDVGSLPVSDLGLVLAAGGTTAWRRVRPRSRPWT